MLSPWVPVYDSETGAGITGDRQYDDFARLLGGRPDPDQGPSNRAVSQAVDLDEPWGRYGESTQLYTSGPVLGQPA